MTIFISAVVLTLTATALGLITAQQAAILLVCTAVLVGINPRWSFWLRWLLAVGTLWSFVAQYAGGGAGRARLLGSVLEFVLLLVAISVMVGGLRGVFKSSSRNRTLGSERRRGIL